MKKIIQFQGENGLVEDGILGPKTLGVFMQLFGLTKKQTANIMGQLHHETNGFSVDVENLNYSVELLPVVFSYYRAHPNEAVLDGRLLGKKANQQAIANKVYWDKNRSDRYKLGNDQWGDGYKYRGRGSIMITGKSNYTAFAEYVKNDKIIYAPDLVKTVYYWKCAMWFMDKNKLWGMADNINDQSIKKLTKSINGGYNGVADRKKWTYYYYNILTR